MGAATQHLIVEQGSKFKKELTIKKGGSVVNITGWTFTGQIRERQSKTSLLIGTFTFAIIDGPNGRVDVTIATALTVLFTPGVWHYDFEYDDGTAEIQRLMRGNVRVDSEVTTT